MSWKIGLTWTKGYWAETENPDGTKEDMYVHGGPFYFNPSLFGLIYIYGGFRPTPTWSANYGDEGLLTPIARWLKKKGWGNLGFALRRAK